MVISGQAYLICFSPVILGCFADLIVQEAVMTDVLIIGGGIGGLAAALSLHQAGISVKVFEAAPKLEALGLGIHLQPNAVRELIELGLGDKLKNNAVAINELAFCNRHGQFVWQESRGLKAGYDWPQYAINRGTLQMLLLETVKERLPAESMLTGHKLTEFEQDENGVTAHFVNTDTGEACGDFEGSVLIGADGLHSVVREKFYPDQEIRFGGQVMWRSAIEAKPFLNGKTFIIAGHKDQKIVAYPMETLANGNVMLNVITELGSAGEAAPREEWNRTVSKEKFAKAFKDWQFDWLNVPDIIESLEVVYEFPKTDRDPVEKWTFGRVTMIGDAAHPMHPVGSQAGSQAIVDGRSLAFHLSKNLNDLPQGLLEYQAERLPAMRSLTLVNRGLGPEVVMDLAEERAPDGFDDISEIIDPNELQEHADKFKKLAGFSVKELNARDTYTVEAVGHSS